MHKVAQKEVVLGSFYHLAGGTMTGIIGSESKEFATLKLNTLQEINVNQPNGGLDINLQPEHSSIFRVADGNKAGFTVDGRHLITASKEQDDELVKENASNYYLTTRKYVVDLHEKNYQLIVDLEEEIDAIVPATERGVWAVEEPNSPNRPPVNEGTFYLMDANDVQNINITRDFATANTIIISDKDQNGALHEWTYAKVGDHIEIMRTGQPDYVVGKITNRQISADGYVTYVYEIASSFGNLEGANVTARLKFFDLSTGLLLESLMPKAGGTFTGNVRTDKGSLTIKTTNTSSGTNFSVTNGSNLEQLKIDGYGNFQYDKSACPESRINDKTVATMGDVGGNVLHTLASSDNMSYRSPKSLSNYEFATDRNSVNGISNVYLYRLKNNENNMVDMADYEPTPTTEFKIYYPSTGEIIFTTLVRNWRVSSYSSGDRMFDTPNYGNFYKIGYSMSTSSSYRVMLTNMKKLPDNRIIKVDKEKETKK